MTQSMAVGAQAPCWELMGVGGGRQVWEHSWCSPGPHAGSVALRLTLAGFGACGIRERLLQMFRAQWMGDRLKERPASTVHSQETEARRDSVMLLEPPNL